MHTLLNLAAVCGCLDGLGVGKFAHGDGENQKPNICFFFRKLGIFFTHFSTSLLSKSH